MYKTRPATPINDRVNSVHLKVLATVKLLPVLKMYVEVTRRVIIFDAMIKSSVSTPCYVMAHFCILTDTAPKIELRF